MQPHMDQACRSYTKIPTGQKHNPPHSTIWEESHGLVGSNKVIYPTMTMPAPPKHHHERCHSYYARLVPQCFQKQKAGSKQFKPRIVRKKEDRVTTAVDLPCCTIQHIPYYCIYYTYSTIHALAIYLTHHD